MALPLFLLIDWIVVTATAIRNENVTAYLVNGTSDVRIKTDSLSLDVTVYNAKRYEISRTLQRHLNMVAADADYVAQKVADNGGFKFHSNSRFVFGSKDDIVRLLQDSGRDIATELQRMVPGMVSYGVYYCIDSSLRRKGSISASYALATKMKIRAQQENPTGTFVIVAFDGPRNITVDGVRI